MENNNEVTVTEAQFDELKRQAVERDAKEPRIANATFDAQEGRLSLDLRGGAMSGARLSVLARELTGLGNATDVQLGNFIVTTAGTSIRWPDVGIGFDAVVLAERICGLHHNSLLEHQRRAGSVKTRAKSASSRANGAKGGRPRKRVAEESPLT